MVKREVIRPTPVPQRGFMSSDSPNPRGTGLRLARPKGRGLRLARPKEGKLRLARPSGVRPTSFWEPALRTETRVAPYRSGGMCFDIWQGTDMT